MKAALFTFEDYKQYLRVRLSEEGRGVYSRLAQAIHSQSAHISQVLRGSSHFSIEQGHGVSVFLKHTDGECEYFLLLIQLGRAGTPQLKAFFKKRASQIRDLRFDLAKRVEVKSHLQKEDEFTYYSAWQIAAAHILLTIPIYRTLEAIQNYLGLDRTRTEEILRFLVSCGLIVAEGDGFRVTESRIHLNQDSPMAGMHHASWRVRAIDAIQKRRREDLHYSSVISLSEVDIKNVKEMLIAEINRIKSVVRDSKSEKLFCLNFDFFEISSA